VYKYHRSCGEEGSVTVKCDENAYVAVDGHDVRSDLINFFTSFICAGEMRRGNDGGTQYLLVEVGDALRDALCMSLLEDPEALFDGLSCERMSCERRARGGRERTQLQVLSVEFQQLVQLR
jgi:hypothetical protein